MTAGSAARARSAASSARAAFPGRFPPRALPRRHDARFAVPAVDGQQRPAAQVEHRGAHPDHERDRERAREDGGVRGGAASGGDDREGPGALQLGQARQQQLGHDEHRSRRRGRLDSAGQLVEHLGADVDDVPKPLPQVRVPEAAIAFEDSVEGGLPRRLGVRSALDDLPPRRVDEVGIGEHDGLGAQHVRPLAAHLRLETVGRGLEPAADRREGGGEPRELLLRSTAGRRAAARGAAPHDDRWPDRQAAAACRAGKARLRAVRRRPGSRRGRAGRRRRGRFAETGRRHRRDRGDRLVRLPP